jgi:glycosyltransferase involved in cell wall biosynthesis
MKRVLILVGIPDFDYSNQMSPVASFLETIKKAFVAEGYYVEFGYTKSSAHRKPEISHNQRGMKSMLKKGLKNWPWLYHSIAFRSYFQRQAQLTAELSTKARFDWVVEFHTVGSTVGKELAVKWSAKFAVVFDSPTEEQFYDMHNTKTWHWSHIVNSEKITLESADNIMAYSPACASHIQLKYNLKAKVFVLPCVIHKANTENSPNDENFNIAFIGSFLLWHKVEVLVDAFKRFNQEYPQSKLQLIGYGEEWKRIKNKVENLGLNDQVEMPGFVSEEDLLLYKRNCSVAVMPGSNWYGSPLKLFEYAQSGIPFIAPVTKTVSAIFADNEHCLYIDAKYEEDSLLEKLRFLMKNPVPRNEMALRAKTFVNTNFEEDVYARKLTALLREG